MSEYISMLTLSSSLGELEEVKKLIEENRANVNAKDKDGYTALMGASSNGYLGIVKYLIGKGAHIDDQTKDGYTALMWASSYGYFEIVKCLIENGADVNIENKDGKTALDLAENEEIKKILEKAMDR